MSVDYKRGFAVGSVWRRSEMRGDFAGGNAIRGARGVWGGRGEGVLEILSTHKFLISERELTSRNVVIIVMSKCRCKDELETRPCMV